MGGKREKEEARQREEEKRERIIYDLPLF